MSFNSGVIVLWFYIIEICVNYSYIALASLYLEQNTVQNTFGTFCMYLFGRFCSKYKVSKQIKM